MRKHPGVPRFGRYVSPIVAAVLGAAAVIAAAITPFSALHGPALLLTFPLWQNRVRRNLTAFTALIERGLDEAEKVL